MNNEINNTVNITESNDIKKAKSRTIKYASIVIALVIIFVVLMIASLLGKNGDSTKSTNLQETTVTTSNLLSTTMLSANENWIGMYESGYLTGCVYNNDKTGIYDNNTEFSCIDGVTCCSGSMDIEYSFGNGSALGGGMAESGVTE